MWDGREPSLFSQAVDATLGHAQADAAPSPAQQQQIVAFEGCTQAADPTLCANTPAARRLHRANLRQPRLVSRRCRREWRPGSAFTATSEASSLGSTTRSATIRRERLSPRRYFDLYDAWAACAGTDARDRRRQAIARGEQIFNTTKINITGVAGLNDVLKQPSIAGFCGTCHDTPNVGDSLGKGTAEHRRRRRRAESPPALDISGLPVFTLWCTLGRLAGQIFQVTDPGRALITGQCADIGKLKGPILRGLAARAPYFHNGSARHPAGRRQLL